MDSELEPLRTSTIILQQAARFFVAGNRTYARKAQKLAAKRSASGRQPYAAFHASLLSCLTELLELLRMHSITTDWQDTEVRAAGQEVLDTYETLIRSGHADDDDDSPVERYWGLHLLDNLYRTDEYPGYRKYLFDPTLELRSQLRTTVERCCRTILKAQTSAQSDADTPSILAEIESITEWQPPPGLSQHAEKLRDVLAQFWSCSCVTCHQDARVAFSLDSKVEDSLSSYELCFASTTSAETTWDNTRLHLLRSTPYKDAKQQLSATRPMKQSVRFKDPHDADVETWRSLQSLCAAFVDLVPGSAIYASEDELKLAAPGLPLLQPQQARPMTSLDKALSDNLLSSVKRKERIALAALTSYIYVCLDDFAWWDVRPNFWFLSSDKLQTRRPFLRVPVCVNGSDAKLPATVEKGINGPRPSLPALGKLLLEIWRGGSCTWGEIDTVMEECKEQDPCCEYWLCAINACLHVDELKQAGSFHEAKDIRSVFIHRVAKSLQFLLEKVCRLTINDLLKELPAHKIQPKTEGIRSPDNSSEHTKDNNLCLYDDSNTWQRADSRRAAAARQWEEDLSNKVHSFVRSLNLMPSVSTQPVKVAILDTGISLSPLAAKLLKTNTRVREFRSWVTAQDTTMGDRRPLSDDNDGHGTYTASVMLRFDPHCEVYVAKVFEGRNENSNPLSERLAQEAVASAMHHAIYQWKVQVISLSFGFDEHIPLINEQILNAERENVVIFAAASNYGANRGHSWPARHNSVMCVYAADGYGNKYDRNPSAQHDEDKFATLGMEVKSDWRQGKKVFKSGTSVATPIASSIATLVIKALRDAKSGYVASAENGMSEEQYDLLLKRLSTYAGMRNVFRLMKTERDHYNVVIPWQLMGNDKGKSVTAVINDILMAVQQA